MMQKVLVGAALIAKTSAFLLQSDSQHAHKDAENVVLEMTNLEDMSFVSEITISGQSVPLIVDTGSFEIVAFQEGCEGCPASTTTFFDAKNSDGDVNVTHTPFAQNYGSGTVYCNASFATVEAKGLTSTGQLFWLADDVDLDFDLDSTFAGIFGMGPPASAKMFAQTDLDWVDEQLEGQPEDVIATNQGIVDGLKATVAVEEGTTPFLGSIASSTFSICLLPGSQQPGKVIFNEAEPPSSWIDLLPTGFWEVSLSNLTIGGSDMATEGEECTAIMDSGTSLIGLPEFAYTKVVALVDVLTSEHGGCDDLEDWPSMEFELGADKQKLTLSPSSYVAKLDTDGDVSFFGEDAHTTIIDAGSRNNSRSRRSRRMRRKDVLNRFMPHLGDRSRRLHQGRGGERASSCEATVFLMGGQIDGPACQFLFGLPLFRDYYVSHTIDAQSGEGTKMAFSKGNADCTGIESQEQGAVLKSTLPLQVKPSKIRFPSRSFREHSMAEMTPVKHRGGKARRRAVQ